MNMLDWWLRGLPGLRCCCCCCTAGVNCGSWRCMMPASTGRTWQTSSGRLWQRGGGSSFRYLLCE
jgi:hypothetical protein